MTIGSGGYGFVSLDPSVCNNTVNVLTTTSLFTGSTIAAGATTTGVSGAGLASGGYSSSQIGYTAGTASGRIVSASIAIQDTSPVLNRGGTMYGLCQPEHDTINGYDSSTMGAFQESYVQPCDSRKHWISAFAVIPGEQAYPTGSNLAHYYSPLSINCPVSFLTNVKEPIMGFLVNATAGNTFSVEIVLHMEYIGQLTAPMQTRTDSDAQGLGHVQEALANTSIIQNAHPNKSYVESAIEALSYVDMHKDTIVNFAKYASAGMSMAPEMLRLMN